MEGLYVGRLYRGAGRLRGRFGHRKIHWPQFRRLCSDCPRSLWLTGNRSERKKRASMLRWTEDEIRLERTTSWPVQDDADYCGEYKSEETLKRGLWWLNSISENEASMLHARNPHELVRCLECHTHITVGEMVIHASLGRKASSLLLGFNRIDYPSAQGVEQVRHHQTGKRHRKNGRAALELLPLAAQCPNLRGELQASLQASGCKRN